MHKRKCLFTNKFLIIFGNLNYFFFQYQILVRIEAEIEKLPTPKIKSQEVSNAKLTRDKIVNASHLNNDVITTPLPSSSNSSKNNKEK